MKLKIINSKFKISGLRRNYRIAKRSERIYAFNKVTIQQKECEARRIRIYAYRKTDDTNKLHQNNKADVSTSLPSKAGGKEHDRTLWVMKGV